MVRHLLWEQGHAGSIPVISTIWYERLMSEISNQIYELVEKFRQELGLKPWLEFEQEVLKKWEDSESLSQEAKDYYKRVKRQCGKTTRGLLFKLAEAKITKRVFLVAGPSTAMTKALYYGARGLADRLNLDVEIEKVHRNTVVYTESFNEA